MKKAYKISPDFYWVGAIDWSLRDFHGYSTEKGSSYNAFLMTDKKNVLFDTVKAGFSEEMIERIQDIVALDKIDYIVVNHVEMDHSGALPLVMERLKPEKIICSQKAKDAMIEHFKRTDWPYHVVATGDTIDVGKYKISFIETPMLHWPDSMFSYIPEKKLLISSDAFGQHWATSERFDTEVNLDELIYQASKYYANIILPYSGLVQNLLKTVTDMGLKIDMIAPDHGLIWTKHIDKIISSYADWSAAKLNKKAVIFYETMWNSTERMAYSISEGLMSSGVGVKLMRLSANHRSDVITEILDAKAVICGSATLNNEMLPAVSDMLTYMRGLKPANRVGACFGSYGWSPSVLKKLNTELTSCGIKLISDGINVKYLPGEDKLKECFELGVKIADSINDL